MISSTDCALCSASKPCFLVQRIRNRDRVIGHFATLRTYVYCTLISPFWIDHRRIIVKRKFVLDQGFNTFLHCFAVDHSTYIAGIVSSGSIRLTSTASDHLMFGDRIFAIRRGRCGACRSNPASGFVHVARIVCIVLVIWVSFAIASSTPKTASCFSGGRSLKNIGNKISPNRMCIGLRRKITRQTKYSSSGSIFKRIGN